MGLESLKTQVISNENLILVDWLTFTTKIWSEKQIIDMLHLNDIIWESKDSYMMGYAHRSSYGGINILSGGREDMGICVTMSGQGCRTFDDFSDLSWLNLFDLIMEPFNEFNVTRLDIAFDDHTGILDIGRILDDTDEHLYRSRSRWWKVEYGSCGTCIYHGSPQSNIRIRIYDKAAERGLTDDTHWIRVELQLRDVNASGAISSYLEVQNLGSVFSGILENYLVYCNPSNDSNKSRWVPTDYWSELLKAAVEVHIAAKPGTEYNIFRLRKTILDQCSGAVYTWIQIEGLDSFLGLLKERKSPLNPKHKLLLDQKKALGGKLHEI